MLHHAIDDEAEQLRHRFVFDELARKHRQRLQSRDVLAVALCDFVDVVQRDRDRRADRRFGDGEHLVGVVLGRDEDDFGVAEADAIAGLERRIAIDARAVEVRTVRGAEIFHEPDACLRDDLGMAARKITVLDRNRAIRGTTDRDCLALQRLPERREER